MTLISQIKELDRHDVARIAKAILATSLSLISILLTNSWTYAIAVDVSKQGRRYYFDVRARLPPPNYRRIINLHLYALPLRIAHTGINMKNTLVKALAILDPNFSRCVGITSDGATSNLGKNNGLVALLEPLMKPGFVKLWCGAHQLDLVICELVDILKRSDIGFMKILDFVIKQSQKQKYQLQGMLECPRYIEVRWWSLNSVCKCQIDNKNLIIRHLPDVDGGECLSANSIFWYGLAIVHRVNRLIV